MARRATRKRRKRRSTEEQIADLEERLRVLRGRVRARERFSPDQILGERDRLELSAADYAELVGVSALTIYNWEKGRTQPRSKELERWQDVRGIGKREAWRKLGLD